MKITRPKTWYSREVGCNQFSRLAAEVKVKDIVEVKADTAAFQVATFTDYTLVLHQNCSIAVRQAVLKRNHELCYSNTQRLPKQTRPTHT